MDGEERNTAADALPPDPLILPGSSRIRFPRLLDHSPPRKMAGSEWPIKPNGDVPQPATDNERSAGRPDFRVLSYVPNIIGYIRLFLLLLAFCSLPVSPASFVTIYSISILLDGIDGYTARKLGQCSLFGAWFDVVLDNLSRGLLWSHIHPMLYLVSALEWMTFVCNHSLGAGWRQSLSSNEKKNAPPTIVTRTFAKNFRNPWGVWAVAGLHVLPVWLFGLQYDIFGSHLWFLPCLVQPLGVVILGTGRLLCACIEIWCIWVHISAMLVNTSRTS